VVWFQILELVIGSTAVSLGLLLAAYMGGMCFGSWWFPRVVQDARPPLRVYALIELGIGLLGILVLYLLPLAAGVAAALFILPPTLLMGATLPALSRSVPGAGNRASALGYLYGANIAGAVLGCLCAGFYLLRLYDVSVATYAAAGVNLAMAAAAVAFARSSPRSFPEEERAIAPKRGAGTVYFAIALSGLCALGAEAIWTRLLGLLFGASVYAFSIILAVFLVGLGLGSGIGAWLCRTVSRPQAALGWCQILAVPAMAWTAYNLSAALPYWPVNALTPSNLWTHFAIDVARAGWALFPPTILWGASFPLALRAAAPSEKQDTARLMARVYAANTLGAIVGALAASLALIAWIGSQHAEQVLMAVSLIGGLALLTEWSKSSVSAGRVAALMACFACILTVPRVADVLIAYGRYASSWVGKGQIVYAAEGMNSSVAVSRFPNGAETFHVAGKIQASNVPRDMRLQRMLGHLTTLTNPHPRSILVVGCGAGVTAGAASIDPQVERETIVEIEPLVPEAASKYFNQANFNVLRNPKVKLRIDDGRHYLLTAKERFDGITIDPLDPWVKGAAGFYTQEFLETLKRHLNPGATVTLYVQLFETDLEAVQSTVATFFEVFPNGTIWGNPYRGQGHDMILLAKVEPLRIDLDQMEQRIGFRGAANPVARSLAEIGMNSPVDLFATYAGRRSNLRQWLRGAAINHDFNLRMQYLAGLGLDRDDAAAIYAGMLAYRRFPDDLFVSTEGRVDLLRDAIRRRQ